MNPTQQKTIKILGLIIFIIFVLLVGNPSLIQGQTGVQLIRNNHAMGLAGDICPQTHDPYAELAGEGWDYSPTMTLSKCGNKNSDGGAMFKNGPVSGAGLPGVPASMWQDYDMASYGFTGGLIQFDFEIEMISLGGVDFNAYLYSSQDGVTFENPVDLLDWPNDFYEVEGRFPIYTGSATLPYAPYYRLELVSLWEAGVGSLGQKWANISLLATGDIVPTATPTATVVPTNTPSPTPTATPITYLPLVIEPGAWELQCSGILTVNGTLVICEE